MTKKNKKNKKENIIQTEDNMLIKAIKSSDELSEKEIATMKKEPWVSVIKTHVNIDNIRNGFFELDWNEYFIIQLKYAGYGSEGDSDESVVDRWFRDLARGMLAEEGLDTDRGAGYINVTKLGNNLSSIE